MIEETVDFVSRKDNTGVDVWVRGWHVHFPASGARPTSTKAPPPEAPGAAADDVIVAIVGGDPTVKVGQRWMVRVGADTCTVLSQKPRPAPDYDIRVRLERPFDDF